MRWCSVALMSLAWFGSGGTAHAALVTYTFEDPQFTIAQVTPLNSVAPNIGDPSFRTDFTSSPTADGFLVNPFTPNSLFSGQSLTPDLNTLHDLVLTFNTPVTYLRVDFATISPGRLELTTPAGGLSVNSVDVDPLDDLDFPGGTLIFSSPVPFTSATLRGFDTQNAQIEFAIDNLQVGNLDAVVPEPATLAVFAGMAGVGGLVVRRRRPTQV